MGTQPEAKLVEEKAKNGDGTIPVCGLLSQEGIRITSPTCTYGVSRGTSAHLGEWETKSRAENDGKKSQPTEAKFNVPWKAAKRFRDKRAPEGGDGLAHNGGGYESEGDYPENSGV